MWTTFIRMPWLTSNWFVVKVWLWNDCYNLIMIIPVQIWEKSWPVKAVQHLFTNSMHAVKIHLCQVSIFYNSWVRSPIILYTDILASAFLMFQCSTSLFSSLCEAPSLQALEHAGGFEICLACVPVYGSAGMDNKTSAWDYKYSCIQSLRARLFIHSQKNFQ